MHFPTQQDLVIIGRDVQQVIGRADAAGVQLDDGNVIDLLADNIAIDIRILRRALVVAGLSARFPKASKSRLE